MKEKFPYELIEREVLIKKQEPTNPKFKVKRDLINYGIINVNKPKGPSSHQTTDYLKKILKINKAGHSGTLDPIVTGSLIIAIGDATRVIEALLKAGKEYVCLMHIHKPVEKEQIKQAFQKYIGTIDQKPPVRSAVKRVERQRKIYYLNILEIDKQDVLFKVGCQAGTYIRKLCDQIGRELQTGAHMTQLVRTRVGAFNFKDSHSLQEIKDSFEENKLEKVIQPIESAIQHLPKVWVRDSAVNTVCHGADLAIPGISKLESNIEKKDNIALLTLKNELIGFGTAKLNSEEIMKNNKGIAIKTKKVFMKRDTYK